jgi:hypothetical protein
VAGGGNASPFGQIMPCAGSGPARLVVTHRGRDWRLPGRCVTPSALAANVHRLGYAALGLHQSRLALDTARAPVVDQIWVIRPEQPAILGQRRDRILGAGQGSHRGEHVDDGLGGQAGHRGGTDVLDRRGQPRRKDGRDPGLLVREQVRPRLVVIGAPGGWAANTDDRLSREGRPGR